MAPTRSRAAVHELAASPREDVVEALAGMRPAWVEVDLDRLMENLRLLRGRCGDGRILAVVKADAYGHGAVPVARALAGAVDAFGVALVEEGVELRRAGIEGPMLVLGTVTPEQAETVETQRLVPVVSSLEQLRMWAERTAGRRAPLGIHLEIDTGMERLGIPADETGAALALVRRAAGLRLDGVLSHLAEADDLASPRTAEQEERFAAVLARLDPAERAHLVVHLANSAGALHHAATRHDLVRLGLALYGVDPADGAGGDTGLRPVMSVAARLVQLRDVAPGTPLGYNGRWRAPRASRIGVVPVGYGDGYPWRLSNRAAAWIAGRRVPVVGAVSMDMLFVDLTELPGVAVGETVVLMGDPSGERGAAGAVPPVSAPAGVRELAAWAETIPYEILCRFGVRLPRLVRRGGGILEVSSRLAAGHSGASA